MREADDFSQFPRSSAVMAFTGLVPRQFSSGKTQVRGLITKTGNAHLRHVLVESAHSYRFRPSLQGAVKRRLAPVPDWEPALRQISWRAQNRLHDRLRRVSAKHGYNAAYTAVGRVDRYYWNAWSTSLEYAARRGNLRTTPKIWMLFEE